MRFFGTFFLAAAATAGLCTAQGAGLTDQELCANLQADYGVLPESCTIAPPQQEARTPPPRPSGLDPEIEESHIFFMAGGSRLDDSSRTKLAAITALLNTPLMQDACLRLVGHSDSVGGAAANQALALKRAEIVQTSLAGGVVPQRILEVMSAGESRPLQGIDTTDPRNRRVELQAKTCPPEVQGVQRP